MTHPAKSFFAKSFSKEINFKSTPLYDCIHDRCTQYRSRLGSLCRRKFAGAAVIRGGTIRRREVPRLNDFRKSWSAKICKQDLQNPGPGDNRPVSGRR